jgi:hypothetical protein
LYGSGKRAVEKIFTTEFSAAAAGAGSAATTAQGRAM